MLLSLSLLNIRITSAQLSLNEVCASNSTVLADGEGEYNDWIEIYNEGIAPIDLAGYALTDDVDNRMQWIFPGYQILPGEYLVLFASGKNRDAPPANWKTLIIEGDVWKYIEPAKIIAGWRDLGFDDSDWASGESGFGYGDGDDATVVAGAVSVYMRKSFFIEEVTDIHAAVLHMDYDDGFVAYINGVEIGRSNVQGDPPGYNELASGGREATIYNGGVPERFDIDAPGDLLQNGENVLAVEVHNVSETSSDMSAIPFLSVLSQQQPGSPAPGILGLSASSFHTNFRLDADGDSLFFVSPAGIFLDSLIYGWQAPDHSFGRKPAENGDWFLFDQPTPGTANITDAYLGYVVSQPVFSRKGGKFQEPFQLTISTAEGDAIYFTTDGSEPDAGAPLYTTSVQVSESTVVKARIIKNGYLPGPATVHTYIKEDHQGLPVISISTDPYNLWDNDYGIYVKGSDANNDFPYFGANFWEDWERPVHIEMYDELDSLAFSMGAGMKIYGGYTRGHPQKSVALFARAEYGARKLEYQLFPDAPIYDFEAFVLRNSGNDWFGAGSESGTMFRDALMTGLTSEMDVEYQKARQAVVYINGEYWGIHNIREKINEHFLASNTGVDPDRVELLTNNQEVIIGDNAHYRALFNFVSNFNMELDANYNYVKQRMEIQNFIYYELAQIYFDNTDWPGNNIKYWRPDYLNGRWRWILYDTDFGFGLWNRNKVSSNTLEFALDPDNNGWPNPAWSTLLLRKLVNNNEFRRQFINTFADHINTSFREERVDQMIAQFNQKIENEMVQHSGRWGGNYQGWRNRVNDLKYFASLRPGVMESHLIGTFGLAGKHNLSIDIEGDENGAVKLNTLLLKDFPWTGTYFEGVPVEVAAVPSPGYAFAGWSGDIESDEARITINLQSAQAVTAHFEPVADPYYARIIINEICYAPDSLYSSEDWVELYNRSDQYIDLSGWRMQDKTSEHVFWIKEGTVVKPHGYYVICKDKYKFRELHTEFEMYDGNFDFGFSSSGDIVRIYNHANNLVNQVSYGIADPWPAMKDGYTLSLLDPAKENFIPGAWALSDEIYGTPGRRNFSFPESVENEVIEAADLLLGNYPNPFSTYTLVTFYSNRSQQMRLTAFDLHGRMIQVLAEGKFSPGYHEVRWTPEVDPGLYVLKLETQTSVQTLRVLKAR